MAETAAPASGECPTCGLKPGDGELHVCIICRSLFCRRCAVHGFGRDFCSESCRAYFFYGDGEDTEKDY